MEKYCTVCPCSISKVCTQDSLPFMCSGPERQRSRSCSWGMLPSDVLPQPSHPPPDATLWIPLSCAPTPPVCVFSPGRECGRVLHHCARISGFIRFDFLSISDSILIKEIKTLNSRKLNFTSIGFLASAVTRTVLLINLSVTNRTYGEV